MRYDTPQAGAGHHRSALNAERGFTLIEMMVVLLVILALAGILIGGISQFRKIAAKTAAQAMLTTISQALEGYQSIFKDLPPSDHTKITAATFGLSTGILGGWLGGELLTQAIASPSNADGVPGYGFHETQYDKKYQSYYTVKNDRTIRARWNRNSADGEQVFGTVWGAANIPQRNEAFILSPASSPTGKPVLYYRYVPESASAGKLGDNFGNNGAVWAADGRFDTDHNFKDANDNLTGQAQAKDVMKYWDDLDPAIAEEKSKIEAFARSLRAAKYLLVLPGADDKWGTEDDLYETGN